jgi:hypothetical protein
LILPGKQQRFGYKRSVPHDSLEAPGELCALGLWPQNTVPVDAAASKEAMIHHALSQQKEGDRQRNKEQDSPNFEPW